MVMVCQNILEYYTSKVEDETSASFLYVYTRKQMTVSHSIRKQSVA